MFKPLSWRNIPTARTLSVLIFIAGIGLIVSVVALLYLSLHLVSSKTNEIDEHRSALSVQGAIQTSINRVWSLVIDNAVWDDAVREVYRPKLDTQWLSNTWGAEYKINNLYDGTFILDEHYSVLWGSFRNAHFAEHNLDFFGAGFKALIDQHRYALLGQQNIYAGITRTRHGIAFIGIGLIRPAAGSLSAVGNVRRYLVITRHIDTENLRALGDTFQIDNLRFSLDKTHDFSVPLRSSAGDLLGYLSWEPQLPGAKAAHAAAREIRQIIILVAGLILLFILLSSAGLYKLAKGEKLARSTAMTDWLSRLPNRRALLAQLETLSLEDPNEAICVVFIDLDGFKDVNDIYGHNVGDRLIVEIAKSLRDKVPASGMLARMGGDEFAMMIGGRQASETASRFAEQVLAGLALPVRLGERTIYIGASIGIACGTLLECTSTELFRRADIAMYHSKMNGKGRISHYDAALNTARERQLTIENDIRDGLMRNEFDVWYQPIVDARSQQMVGVEALVRWPRRPAGTLPPDQFVTIAETSGLIHALGQFVLRRACVDLQPLSDLKLSVNISPAQFRDPAFEEKVAGVLRDSHFPAHRLQLEVTETYVLENPDRACAALGNLKALGTAIALDDFGTGYSSIGYLRRFNFDTIKIDKSLAGLIDNDEQAAALVGGTIQIASALGMTVIAEGVENEKQMKLLRLAGCDRLQGFFFSAPMPIDALRQHRQRRQG